MSSNLFPYPEAFDDSAWTKARLSATANVLAAPNGLVVADKIRETADSGTHGIYDGATFVAGVAYCFSVYARKAERSAMRLTLPDNRFPADVYANFNLASGTVNFASNCTAICTSVGNDWFRCSISAIATVSGSASPVIYILEAVNTSASYAGVAGSGIYVWGAKIERSSAPTQYQPESGYVSWLDETTPEENTAYLYLGDNEIRSLKSIIKTTFPNIGAPVSASPAEWNALDGLESDWATQLAAKADTIHDHDGEAIGVVTLGDGSRATTQPLGDDSTKVATTAFTRLGIAAAGLASSWEEVAVLDVASTTSLEFSATTAYDHYRVMSAGLRTHGNWNLEMQFGTAGGWITGEVYRWGVNYVPGTGSASSDTSDTSIELDATRNIAAGPLALDMQVYSRGAPAQDFATWKMAGISYGAPTVFVGGGSCYRGAAQKTRWRVNFAAGGGASFSGRVVLLGRRK